ncbi:MAG: hypothetical protein RI989_980 [Bacteroidota bacterium]|jgi:uncharacterized YigZ family protein
MASYRTISKEAESLYKVSGSKHIGKSFRVHSEKQAKQIIQNLWEEHPQATHICFAYQLSIHENLERSSDDGEPGGTAGKPILNQIKSAKLTEVLVAVIRYYGGTKLGVSGLIDAYKNAAKLALDESGVEECEVEVQYLLEVSHEETPALMNALNRLSFRKINTTVEMDFKIEISIKEEMEAQLLSVLKDLRLNSLKAENLAKHLS